MTIKKSIYNPCPICGLPRGKGKYEFVHGKCLEIRSVTEGKKNVEKFSKMKGTKPLTVENLEKSRINKGTKAYISGKLPKWMFD